MIQTVLNRVLLKRTDSDQCEVSGIWLPEPKHANVRYEVLSAGPDCRHVAKGDVVLIDRLLALEVFVGTDRFKLIPEENILAKIQTQ